MRGVVEITADMYKEESDIGRSWFSCWFSELFIVVLRELQV